MTDEHDEAAPGGVQAAPVMALTGITKSFGDVAALDDVSLDLIPGEVHALLGANGSGKSTLVKVMTGVYQPDAGALAVDGVRLSGLASPAEAGQRGVRVVHQESPLIDTLSVTEAVAIFRGFGTGSLGRIGWRRLRRQVQDLLDRMDVPVSAAQLCGSIGPADRAGLALAIVVGELFGDHPEQGARLRLLLVDEVTAAIHESETGRHLDRLRALADSGVAVVMVTHRLAELRIADRLTVLRGGQVVRESSGGSHPSAAVLVAEMVGPSAVSETSGHGHGRGGGDGDEHDVLTELWQVAPRPDRRTPSPAQDGADPAPAISAVGLTGLQLQDASFTAVPGEVLGFAGLRGSGVEELPRLLSGDQAWVSGDVTVCGQRIARGGQPRTMIEAGLTAIPADRLRAGGVASLSVRENIALPSLREYWHRRALWDRVTDSVVRAFDVRPAGGHRLFGALSGGNQQKVLLGKWLLLRPGVLVLDDPTYGVDPAAREIIFQAVADAARRGVCVLFLSTEPEQLVRLCDRILILKDGAIMTELSGADIVLETVLERSYQ